MRSVILGRVKITDRPRCLPVAGNISARALFGRLNMTTSSESRLSIETRCDLPVSISGSTVATSTITLISVAVHRPPLANICNHHGQRPRGCPGAVRG